MRQIAVFAALAVTTLLAACGQTSPSATTRPSSQPPAAETSSGSVTSTATGFETLALNGNFNPNNFDTSRIMDAIKNPKSDLVIVSSHRGNHALVDGRYPNVPENSLEAIGLAAQSGIEEIEIDVKLTQDGVPILSHDTTWGREQCNATPSNGAFGQFDPFGSRSSNDSYNPAVDSWSLSYSRRNCIGYGTPERLN
ncbi:lipoprotein [Deinococcus sp.]|uniref:glycerophosphodiester phosphodiesterase family protein n=1 Tax=Deinococcus sp. TaxID=47478 RepID=UPI0025E63634|nr:lipoprotein [Deinococcus sp.]